MIPQKSGSDRRRGQDTSWAWAAAGAVVALSGGKAGAQIAYTPLDVTLSNAPGGTTSYTIAEPDNGLADRQGDNILTVNVDPTNGIYGSKPSTAGTAVDMPSTGGTNEGGGNTLYQLDAFSAGQSIFPPAVVTNGTSWMQFISPDGSTGAFTTAAGLQYAGFGFGDSTNGAGNYYYGWIGFQTLSTGSVLSGEITGVALESTPNLPIIAGSTVAPPTLTWSNSGAGSPADGHTWDKTNNNWNNGSGATTYSDGSSVVFNDSNNGHYAVTLNTTLSPGVITVNNSSGNYTISGAGARRRGRAYQNRHRYADHWHRPKCRQHHYQRWSSAARRRRIRRNRPGPNQQCELHISEHHRQRPVRPKQ